jgi:hypothetical protein
MMSAHSTASTVPAKALMIQAKMMTQVSTMTQVSMTTQVNTEHCHN